MNLEQPQEVIRYLNQASNLLGDAHRLATESYAGEGGLTGPVRDMLFGLNTSVEALIQIIQEQHE